ncbi:MFS transporter [Niveibacterium umoris]|uniref:MFS family permease n=1 Tax=Niveibacterium umoris TaxID=1193620 RepID=A0A840BQ35_9RHOO|nr:MFS transporter [Niveibacterium umoris]MBB4012946.1 MFS family permease [Niveibacterium umoris]
MAPTALPQFARALRSLNYRRYFIGQLISLAGTWMQQIAMSWLAYRLTHSALVLGMISFFGQIPILLFASVGGVWVDRVDRRKLLLATQFLAMMQAGVLAIVSWQALATPTLLMVLAFALGCLNALDVPARQAVAVQLVDNPDDLPNAIALNALLMNGARFVGPALAGVVVAEAGETACFVLNALSYLAVLAALAGIRLSAVPKSRGSALAAFHGGYRYALQHPTIRLLLLLVAGVSFFATSYSAMLPIFAREVFGGGARTYGLLVGSAGVGSLIASLVLAARDPAKPVGNLIAWAAPGIGFCLALFALTPWLGLAFVELMALGFCVIVTVAGSNTVIQSEVDEAYRGRVVGLYSMAFLGVSPLGSLAVGALAHAWGTRPTLLCGAFVTVLLGLTYRHVALGLGHAASGTRPDNPRR